MGTILSRPTTSHQSMGQCSSLGNAHTTLSRTSEFLWQEGHTVHATEEEAVKEHALCSMSMPISLEILSHARHQGKN